MLKLFKKFGKEIVVIALLAVLCVIASVICDLKLPSLMSSIINNGVVKGDSSYIINVGAQMLVWAFGSAASSIAANFFAARAAMSFGRNVRNATYKRVTSFSQSEIDKFGTSSLITRTTNDAQQLERFIILGLSMATKAPVMLVGAVVMSLMVSKQLSLVALCAVPVLLVLVAIIIKLAMPLLRSLQKRIDALNLVTREGLSGIRVIRAFRREAYEEKRFAHANKDLAETNLSVARRMSLLMPFTTLVLNLVMVALVWVGAVQASYGSLEVGSLMAVIQYAMHVLISVMMLSMIFMLWPRAVAAAERIKEVIETRPSVVDAKNAQENTKQIDVCAAHEICFENVFFAYDGASLPAIKDLNLKLEAGKTYALVGSTGCGKSTLVNLLMRFYNPSSGRILMDGTDIAALPQEFLRKQIAYVPQKTVLFSGTLAENIKYGNKDANEADVKAAAKAAQAYDFIMQKPDGFQTQITQAGTNLSGGQKQRISIARAMIKKCGLYIFDDAFSALDFKTDALVREACMKATQGATRLIVAQRVSAAMDADCIIVLENGQLNACGSHEELLQSCEIYKEIAASQLEEGEL